MQVTLTVEQEMRLSELASRTGRSSDQLVQDAIDRLLDHEEWFARQVRVGLAQIEHGEFVESADVLTRVRRRLET